jgi:hypothetical protein
MDLYGFGFLLLCLGFGVAMCRACYQKGKADGVQEQWRRDATTFDILDKLNEQKINVIRRLIEENRQLKGEV